MTAQRMSHARRRSLRRSVRVVVVCDQDFDLGQMARRFDPEHGEALGFRRHLRCRVVTRSARRIRSFKCGSVELKSGQTAGTVQTRNCGRFGKIETRADPLEGRPLGYVALS